MLRKSVKEKVDFESFDFIKAIEDTKADTKAKYSKLAAESHNAVKQEPPQEAKTPSALFYGDLMYLIAASAQASRVSSTNAGDITSLSMVSRQQAKNLDSLGTTVGSISKTQAEQGKI